MGYTKTRIPLRNLIQLNGLYIPNIVGEISGKVYVSSQRPSVAHVLKILESVTVDPNDKLDP